MTREMAHIPASVVDESVGDVAEEVRRLLSVGHGDAVALVFTDPAQPLQRQVARTVQVVRALAEAGGGSLLLVDSGADAPVEALAMSLAIWAQTDR